MPFLQFLSGARDQAVEELHASASMILGSGGDAQVQCADAGVQPSHCQVYPADGKYWLRDLGAGSTVFKMRRIGPNNPPETVPLAPGDVFIIGQTYVKFWAEQPPVGGGGGGGADPAALEAAEAQARAAQEELEAARGELGELRAQLEELQAGGSDAARALEQAQGELARAQSELESVRGELSQAQSSLSGARSELEAAQGEASAARAEVDTVRGELEAARAEQEAALEAARGEHAAALEASQAEAAEARAGLESALEATRGTLAAMRVEAEARDYDPLAAAAGPADWVAVVEALGLLPDLRSELERALRAEIDREVLRRIEGPVVPLRGLRVPGLELDLEQAVGQVRARNERLGLIKQLGLSELDTEELERLLELARS